MTQASFLSSLPPTYLIDTCCPMDLDGRNRVLDGQPEQALLYTATENARIWAGLESLANEGRLKLIREVREELRRHYPEGLARLESLPLTVMPRVGVDLRRRYQALLSRYPDLMPDEDIVHDPADPWLIVSAQKYVYAIMTDELRENEQKGR